MKQVPLGVIITSVQVNPQYHTESFTRGRQTFSLKNGKCKSLNDANNNEVVERPVNSSLAQGHNYYSCIINEKYKDK